MWDVLLSLLEQSVKYIDVIVWPVSEIHWHYCWTSQKCVRCIGEIAGSVRQKCVRCIGVIVWPVRQKYVRCIGVIVWPVRSVWDVLVPLLDQSDRSVWEALVSLLDQSDKNVWDVLVSLLLDWSDRSVWDVLVSLFDHSDTKALCHWKARCPSPLIHWWLSTPKICSLHQVSDLLLSMQKCIDDVKT